MTSHFKAQVANQDVDRDSFAHKGETLKSAATDWAGGFKEVVHGKVVETGTKAETYVRSHPGRFIAGACCVGLAAGWFLGRGRHDNS